MTISILSCEEEVKGPKNIRTIPGVIRPAVLLLSLLVIAGSAHAATGGGGLPWEAPMTTLSNSVTGPVAYGASLIGLVGAGGVLIFAGGVINEFLRAVMFLVLVIALIISGKNTLTAFGFAAGATIGRGIEHVEKADRWHSGE